MKKQKFYAVIKIGGFAIGIAACLLIGLLIRNELSYDKHIQNAANLYRMVGAYSDKGVLVKGVAFPAPMSKAIKNDFPEIENSGRLMPSPLFYGAGSNQVRRAESLTNTYEEGFCYADQSILDMFNLPMVYGDRKRALVAPNSLVLTKSKAEKYFPGQNPVGKIIYLNDDKSRPFTVGGVIQDWPETSHIKYSFLLTLSGVSFWDDEQATWMASNYTVYLQLKQGTNIKQFEKKSTEDVLNKYYIPAMKESGDVAAEEIIKSARLIMQPIEDIHLKSYDMYDTETRGDIRFIWMFAAIACFILVIACINFLNLSTARSANRAKEVGVRKVIGSQRTGLIKQFLVESLLYSLISFAIGLALAWALLPLFNQVAGKNISMPWRVWWTIPVLLGSAGIIGLLAGIYPSFYLSAFRPILVLKGNLSKGSRNAVLRSTLVVFQFTISIVLLIGTVVIYRQMQFILNTKTGFEKDQVVMLQGANTLANQSTTFKNEVLKLPQVKDVTVTGYLPISGTKRDGNPFWKEGKNTEEASVSGQKWYVDKDYIPALGIKLLEGRNFESDRPTDSQACVINKTMADKIGYKEPLGKKITNGWQHFTIIGVVEDFHFETFKQKVEPLCLALGNSNDVVSVKLKAGGIQESISSIDKIWKKFLPHQPMRYVFMDESFARMYDDVRRTGIIFTSFSVLAIFIACLGLFALASFIAEQRGKEISIRKVLGASTSGLFALLTNNFLKLVGIAMLIAAPVGWWLMQKWLQDFAYKISIGWWVFAVSGTVAIIIALGTVSFQALKAALSNPVDGLRSE